MNCTPAVCSLISRSRIFFSPLGKVISGKGYAKPAVQLILQEIRSRNPNTDIYLSVYAENHSAITLYRSSHNGFTVWMWW